MINKQYIEPEPISLISGLLLWTILIWWKFDLMEGVLSGISLILYGYSISYGSKSYKTLVKLIEKEQKEKATINKNMECENNGTKLRKLVA